jgi:S1-C subfamily serine protease
VNRKPVATANEFRRALQQAGNQPVLLLIDRGGEHLFVAIETH